ncbi:hypothetical protein [Helicobacter bizzozeronii]|nr:hypothetical protein [Helicobacter bizzozeronii]
MASYSLLIRGGGGAIVAGLLFVGCTTRLDTINPNQPLTGNTTSVFGYACNSFTWPYGKAHNEELKQRAMQQVQQQANTYASGFGAKQGELINISVTKEIYPWFWWLLGSECVKVRGFARPASH